MTKVGAVTSFRDEYSFLSNHYTAVFDWRGRKWFCVEQAFQWAKTGFYLDGQKQKADDIGKRLCDAGSGYVAKRYGREIPLDVAEWDKRKVSYMREIVHAKFRTSQPGLTGQLINTGAMMLVEGNDWGDTFWGRCKDSNGKWTGYNTLGVILMEERGWWSRGDEGKPAWVD